MVVHSQPTTGSNPIVSHYRLKWKHSISRLVLVAQPAMEKAKFAYKRDFDARLRGNLLSDINLWDYAFIRTDYYNPEREKPQKLSPIAEGQ